VENLFVCAHPEKVCLCVMRIDEKKITEKKTAKGYRLKPETHEIINELRHAVEGDLDFGLRAACRKLLNEIRINKTIKEKLK
jgi:hypothetical protein